MSNDMIDLLRRECHGEIVFHYFQDNPEKTDDVIKASYAYHINPAENPQAHVFQKASNPEDPANKRCTICDRSPVEVRWDDKPPRCTKRTGMSTDRMKTVIENEEQDYFALIEKAHKELPKKIDSLSDMTGEEIAVYQHTHGYPPDIIEHVFGESFTEKQINEFQIHMDKHREAS